MCYVVPADGHCLSRGLQDKLRAGGTLNVCICKGHDAGEETAISRRWLQIRGDPSIRRFLYRQSRSDNEFDNQLEEVLDRVGQLLGGRGIFHAKVHFSSGQVTLWPFSDPYNYQVHLKDEFLASGFMRMFAAAPYPINAAVPPRRIAMVLDILRWLRCSDDSVYLRSGSLNIMNGMVGLNFSCDGSHYIDYRDFLAQGNTLYECRLPVEAGQ